MAGVPSVQRDDSPRKNDDNMVGLVNQGATGYLNSLLQILFALPEFRQLVLEWSPPKSTAVPPEQSIVSQLKLLFQGMQSKAEQSLKTDSLITSFGWGPEQAYVQHDAQELFRVLFDAICTSFRDDPKYEAKLLRTFDFSFQNYVRSIHCPHRSERMELCRDLSLTLQPSIEESLVSFTSPEVLDGDNRYMCSGCNKKVDAIKGTSFLEFPAVLVLSLMRFCFDYRTFERVKLNSYWSFPLRLDVNYLLGRWSMDSHLVLPQSARMTVVAVLALYLRNEHGAPRHRTALSSLPLELLFEVFGQLDVFADAVDERVRDKDASTRNAIRSYVSARINTDGVDEGTHRSGENIFELAGIMMHAGSAGGGHYFAYTRDPDSNVWYECNDTVVRRCPMTDIAKSYGTDYEAPASERGYGANAYMLFYRRARAPSS